MDGVIHHEYFYPEGPETVEYLLHATKDCEIGDCWMASLRGLDRTRILERLQARFASLPEGPLAILREQILRLTPKSLVTHKDRWWLLLSLDPSSATSEFGNMLMIPSPNASEFDLIRDAVCQQFLREFAGACNTIPPSNGFLWPDQLPNFVFRETSDNYGFVPDEWRDSVGFYLPGNGDVLVMRQDGVIGRWSHETGWSSQTESPFTQIAESFAEIVPDYVAHFADGAKNAFH